AGVSPVAGMLLGGGRRLPVDVVALRRVEKLLVHRVVPGAQARRSRSADGVGRVIEVAPVAQPSRRVWLQRLEQLVVEVGGEAPAVELAHRGAEGDQGRLVVI